MLDGVERGRDIEETEARDLLMTDIRDQFMMERDKQSFYCLVKTELQKGSRSAGQGQCVQ